MIDRSRLLGVLVWGLGLSVVALVTLPLLGMALAYHAPPGLVEPPPLEWARVWPLAARSLALASLVAVTSLVLGTALGFAEARAHYPGRAWLGVASVMPLAVPSYLIAAIIRESLAPEGALGSVLGTSGAFAGFGPAALVLSVACTPYVQLLVRAALQALPQAEEEAARSLGASRWRCFRELTMPRLRPTWAFSLVLVTLYVLSDFGAVAVLDCEVLTWELYQARGARDAVVLGCAIMIIVLPIFWLLRRLAGEARPERRIAAERGTARQKLRGVALFAVYLAHAFIIGLGLVLPLVMLVVYLISGWRHGQSFAPIGAPLWNTALFTVFGAALTVSAALAPAWLAARRASRRGAAVIENASYLTSAVPGILLAFGLLHLSLGLERGAALPGFSGQSLWRDMEAVGVFLMLGYVMRFLAQAYAALKPAILALDPAQEESARSLGASPLRRLAKVTLPALTPGLGAAALLVFLSIAKELPVTLMLTPLGRQTLAYRVFDAQQESSLPDLGLAGLMLLALALGVQLIATRWRRYD